MHRGIWITALLLQYSSPAQAEITAKEFADYIYSYTTFLENCEARKKIVAADIHNKSIRMARQLGIEEMTDWLEAAQRGAKGEVYNLVAQRWVRAQYNQVNCQFMLRENQKIYNTLSSRLLNK
jgi:hypothetical protein